MSSDNANLWMCLYFDKLPLEIFTRGETLSNHDPLKKSLPNKIKSRENRGPEHTGKPIVVLQKQRVFRLNQAALDIGIKPGNSMDTAYTLSDRVISFERNEDKEISTLAHLAQWAYQFTPNVSIKAPDSLLLDITGCLNLFKGLQPLILRVEQGLRQLGYQAVISTNRTPLAALLVARAHAPDGSINQIPVRYLQTDEKIITSLHQMGIHNVEDLLRLPESGLTRRFGVYFADYLQRLVGSKPDPQKLINPSVNFFHDITFLSDVSNLDSLTFPINRLLGELAEFLTSRQLQVNHFTWHLSHRNHNNKSFSIHLANPENNPRVFRTLTQLRLDQINDVKEIDNIALAVSQFFPAKAVNGSLFQGAGYQELALPSNTDKENQLLNMIHARLGPGYCFGLSQSNDHRPEKAWQTVSASTNDKKHPPTERDWLLKPDETPARPAFLLPTPKALNVADNIPCLAGKLELIKGPERIDYGWWDQPINKPLTRDYYIARQKDGSLYWIFQHIAMGQWYLHGIFS
ncbi:MAG TPA: DNA polymerase Y family protein [Gammaproteobacteria bacterium]|nr:DNA polymerase Y family protein [Gammaproteobacteria bacterium]HIL98984.1 DNA polymerase Y family protein [Pseudomonadales bacterium]